MALSSTTITATAVANTLGTSDLRLSALCTSGNINKWSKHKPIKHSSSGPLNTWIGEESDRLNGYYYGLHSSANDWSDIHTADYTYVRPSGTIGVAPYRLLDFRSYERGAIPVIYGTSDNIVEGGLITPSAQNAFALYLNYTGSTYGVNPLECAENTMAASSTYLFVMIGTKVRAMINSRHGNIVTPIYYSGMYVDTWVAPEVASLGISAGSYAYVTVFLSNIYEYNGVDLRTTWYDVRGKDMGGTAVALPNGTSTTAKALSAYIEFNSSSSAGFGEIAISASFSSPYIRFLFEVATAPSVTSNYKVISYLCNSSGIAIGGTTETDTFSLSAGQTLVAPVQNSITDYIAASGTYILKAELYGVHSSGNTTLLDNTQLTFTYNAE